MNGTRYRCLVLDHDDTAVMSTPSVNYPSFVETLARLRPGAGITLHDYRRLCFDPGFERMCFERFHFSPEEMDWQLRHWEQYTAARVPPFHSGVPELIRRQKAAGGLVCVVSQNYSRFVERDYAAAGLPLPDRTLGWEIGSARQKPHPDPLYMLMEAFRLVPADILVVDDLKPGLDMAAAAGCDYAAALWAYQDDPGMVNRLLAACRNAPAFHAPEALADYLFGRHPRE